MHAAHHHAGHHAAAVAHQHLMHPATTEFLDQLSVQSPLDVYDIHEAGWRRALLLAKRDRHEYLVRYIGWDTKWDEWIRASAGRLAPSNSKTSTLAYTGFKGPKTADEIASSELGRDWNAARQEGVMCDVLFALHSEPAYRRTGFRTVPVGVSPTKLRNNNHHVRKDETEGKGSANHSTPSTPATSPMVRGLSGLGIISPHIGPLNGAASAAGSSLAPAPIQYFSAHQHIITMRCPDLLKNAVISLPPITTFDEPPQTPFQRGMSAGMQQDERKDETGGRSLADQEMAAAAAGSSSASAASSILNYSLTDMEAPSASPELSLLPSPSPGLEEKSKSLDEEDGIPSGMLSRSGSFGANGSGYSELHPAVTTYDINCVPNAATMHNLLTYLYTGDLAMHFLPTIRHVFELATVARTLHLDRLLDLCALAMNRMLTQDNFLNALKLGLHFQSKVLGNLDTILTALQDASLNATRSIAHDLHASMSTLSNAKIHPHLSPLIRVCFEYIILHWDICWSNYETMQAFQQLPPQLFQMIMRLLPLKNVHCSQFNVIYPTIHPQACNLTSHFKRLYEDRTEDNTDFRIIIGEGDDEHVIHVHKAVLACRSEYFRALFRCSFEEGKDSCVRLDSTQHNEASTEALVKYLYSADLKVDPNCGVYLSNCTDFFGLSSSALEHACQELVSQHHCLKVLKSAWKSCNEGLFKRACKFIDWTTLAKLMNGGSSAAELEDEEEHMHDEDDEEIENADDDDAPDEAELMEQDDVSDAGEAVAEEIVENQAAAVAEDVAAAAAPAAAAADVPSSITASPVSSSLTTPLLPRSRSISSPAFPSVDVSVVEMWKAIVSEKANPSPANSFIFGKSGAAASSSSSSMKRQRATSS